MTPIMIPLNYDIPKLPTNNKSIATKFPSDVPQIKNEQAVTVTLKWQCKTNDNTNNYKGTSI
ncbi:19743_t:CDS:2 [Racocetra persica]|uniref:19743_t:CDS:1 n=1 Tax=Racocetra persica TaxID=160502 RepID=A0ACA9PJ59_9GLOM|nr:19743_t:CDS:2 [Racocetra persica]